MVGMAGGAWCALRRRRVLRGGSRTEPATAGCGGYRRQRPGQPPPNPLLSQGGEYRKLALLQLLAAASPLLLYALFVLLASVRCLPALLTINPMVFPLLALIAGLLGGFQFPLASRLYFSGSPPLDPLLNQEGTQTQGNPGILYGLDLFGACLGAVALSAYLLPVYGFLRTAVLMAAVNLGPAALAALAAFELRARRTRAL